MDRSLKLRKVTPQDMDLLFCWANDDTVRANAFHTEKIPYENHIQWFEKMISDAAVYQNILYDGDVPDRKSTRLNSSHTNISLMTSYA